MIAIRRAASLHGGNHICRGCGCTDDHACILTVTDGAGRAIGEQPCCWIVLDVDTPTGVCSGCAVEVEWDQELIASLGRDPHGVPLVLQRTRVAAR